MQPRRKYADEELIALMRELGSPQKVSEKMGIGIRTIYSAIERIRRTQGIDLVSFAARQHSTSKIAPSMLIEDGKRVINYNLRGGVMMVGSDCHYWPNELSVAHEAFVNLAKELKPAAICMNGDVFDGARVSRHDPLYADNPPSVREEIEVCVDRLGEIERASHNSKLFWTYGNHDTRMWRYMRMNAPEMQGVNGTDLFDHFPGWHRCYVIHMNDNTVIKHRWHNGVHATYNNALKGGRNIVTGHLHRLCITPWGDYNGRRYGVDTGTMADPTGPQFTYLEGNPVPWASGFAVLTFDENGMLLPPELCEIVKGIPYFRGRALI